MTLGVDYIIICTVTRPMLRTYIIIGRAVQDSMSSGHQLKYKCGGTGEGCEQ